MRPTFLLPTFFHLATLLAVSPVRIISSILRLLSANQFFLAHDMTVNPREPFGSSSAEALVLITFVTSVFRQRELPPGWTSLGCYSWVPSYYPSMIEPTGLTLGLRLGITLMGAHSHQRATWTQLI
jgi:hypothetical protein